MTSSVLNPVGSTNDFYTEVAKGNVPGHRLVHKFGRNLAVPSGSWAHLSQAPFDTNNFNQAPVAVRIKAGGDVNDVSAGSGAGIVVVNGIDDSFNEISVPLVTAGVSASAPSTELFWRIHRAWAEEVGTYTGANIGDIVIEDSAGTKDYLVIGADEGQSQYAGYTVPDGETAYLLRAWGTVDGTKPADVRLLTRSNIDAISAPVSGKRLKLWWDGVIGDYEVSPRGAEFSIPAKSDIWMEANGSGAGTEGTGNFELLIVKDGF